MKILNAVSGTIHNPDGWVDAGPNEPSSLDLSEPAGFAFQRTVRNLRHPGSNRKLDSSLSAAPGQNFTAISGCHAGPETMFPFSFFGRWMISSFHIYQSLANLFRFILRSIDNGKRLSTKTGFFTRLRQPARDDSGRPGNAPRLPSSPKGYGATRAAGNFTEYNKIEPENSADNIHHTL